jgi:hypothetical protein
MAVSLLLVVCGMTEVIHRVIHFGCGKKKASELFGACSVSGGNDLLDQFWGVWQ